MAKVVQYLSVDDAAQLLRATAAQLGTDELVAVRNLGFIPHPRELYFLAPRAAGFGLTIGLPNRDTSRQNYSKASCVVHGGLPELVLERGLCVGL